MTRAFVDYIKKLKPAVQIVDQQWPKLGEQDYNPFINAQMAKKPEAVVSSICGGFFVTYSKQAQALGFFDALKHNFIGPGRSGIAGDDQVYGQRLSGGHRGSSYDAFYWDTASPAHRDYTVPWAKFTGRMSTRRRGPSKATSGMQFLAEAIKKAGSTDSDKVAKALLGPDRGNAGGPAHHPREGSSGQSRAALRQDGEGR